MDKPLEGGLNVLAEMVSAVKSKFLTEEHDEFEQEDFPEIIKEEIIKPTPKVSKLAILTVCPSGFEEAKALVKELVQGKALLFSFSKLNNEDKQRTFDFLNGVAYVINANVEKVTREKILYSPANAKVERLTKLSSLEKKGFQII